MEVYVFPLNQMLLYPGVSKPLHIVEAKYLQMIRDSIQSATPIAIGCVDEPGKTYNYRAGERLSFVRDIVGFGFPTIVEERTDGTLLVFLHGVGKARLGAVLDKGTPYITCAAELLTENAELETLSHNRMQHVQKVLMRWLHTHIPDPHSRAQFLSQIQSPQEVIGCYASYLLADHDMKQLILESNDINEKVRLLEGLIASGEIIH